jgi:hypothetical protein
VRLPGERPGGRRMSCKVGCASVAARRGVRDMRCAMCHVRYTIYDVQRVGNRPTRDPGVSNDGGRLHESQARRGAKPPRRDGFAAVLFLLFLFPRTRRSEREREKAVLRPRGRCAGRRSVWSFSGCARTQYISVPYLTDRSVGPGGRGQPLGFVWTRFSAAVGGCVWWFCGREGVGGVGLKDLQHSIQHVCPPTFLPSFRPLLCSSSPLLCTYVSRVRCPVMEGMHTPLNPRDLCTHVSRSLPGLHVIRMGRLSVARDGLQQGRLPSNYMPARSPGWLWCGQSSQLASPPLPFPFFIHKVPIQSTAAQASLTPDVTRRPRSSSS